MKSKVKADIPKNRLHFTFAGRVAKKEMDSLYTDTRFCVADMKRGFDVISDFSECTLIQLAGISQFRKIMNYLIANNVGEIVRIVNKRSLLYRQIINYSSIICGYRPIYVSSIEQAEEKLDKSIRRNGIRFHLKNLPIEYEFNNVTESGSVINISTSGCAILSEGVQKTINDEITLKIDFESLVQENNPKEFHIKSKIVRVDGDGFAVKFEGLDNEQIEKLRKSLIDESQR